MSPKKDKAPPPSSKPAKSGGGKQKKKMAPIVLKMSHVDKGSYSVDGGSTMRGSEFRVYAGVRDNDTLETPGVASRLGWATILPRDKHRLFRNFPEGEDLADVEAMRLAQRTIVNNAQHRAYRDQTDKELQALRDKVVELTNANNQLSELPGVVKNLEYQLSKALQDLNRAKWNLIVETARSNKLNEDFQQAQAKLDNMKSKYDSLFTSFNGLTNCNQELKQHITELESRATPSLNQVEIDSIRAEAVKEYRLSKDCLRRKEDFSVSYVKYGFYLARSWLEKHREGEEFPELLYTPEAMLFECPDWTKYEPDAEPSNEFLKKVARDDLVNLTGPWQPVSPENVHESIGALDDLDGEDSSPLDPQPTEHANAD